MKQSLRTARVPLWMWGAVVTLLTFTSYISWETVELNRQIAATNEKSQAEVAKHHELEEKLALAQRQAIILTDPHSIKIPLRTDNKNLPKLEAVWHPKLGIVVSGSNVPTPSGTRTFQLWLIPKVPRGKPMPSLTSRPDANGKFVMLVASPPNSMEATKALAITEEPANGRPQPTTKPIWVGAIGSPRCVVRYGSEVFEGPYIAFDAEVVDGKMTAVG